MRFSRFIFGSLLAALLLLGGCARFSPYRENKAGQPIASVVSDPRYQLAFVEFGEQGSYQDTSQLEQALALIRRTPRPLVITYVHGWQNNAASADATERFPGLLKQLGNSPAIRAAGYNVIGIYMGWRGQLSKVPVIKELSFYSRKAAAERLASNFDCYDAIAAVSEEARKHGSNENQFTVLIGHSFGGLVVERSVAHAINAEIHGHGTSDRSLPADLILLLNPASDSILSRQMISALYSRAVPDNRQLVVSLTSTQDGATGKAFRIGTGLAALREGFNRVRVPSPGQEHHIESEREFYTTTPGHSRFLLNHATVRRPDVTPNPQGQLAFDFNLEHRHDGHGFVTDSTVAGHPLQAWEFQELPGPFGFVKVPYWDVAVDPEIIKDHGDIWNVRAQAMVAAIFRMNFPPRLAAAGPKPSILPPKQAPAPPAIPSLQRPVLKERQGYNQTR